MNLHLEVEISEIFYLKPRGGEKKKNVAGKKNRKWKLKMQNDSGFFLKQKAGVCPQAEFANPSAGSQKATQAGAAGSWAGPAQLVRRVGCAPGRTLPRCTPARAPLGASAGTRRRNDTGSPGRARGTHRRPARASPKRRVSFSGRFLKPEPDGTAVHQTAEVAGPRGGDKEEGQGLSSAAPAMGWPGGAAPAATRRVVCALRTRSRASRTEPDLTSTPVLTLRRVVWLRRRDAPRHLLCTGRTARAPSVRAGVSSFPSGDNLDLNVKERASRGVPQ